MQNRPEENSAERSIQCEGASAADNLRSDAGLYKDNEAARNSDSKASPSRGNEHSILVPSKEQSILVPSKEHSILVQNKMQPKEHSILIPHKEHSVLVPNKEHSVLVPSREHSILLQGKEKTSERLGNLTIDDCCDKGEKKGSDWFAEEKPEPPLQAKEPNRYEIESFMFGQRLALMDGAIDHLMSYDEVKSMFIQADLTVQREERAKAAKELEDAATKMGEGALAALKDDPLGAYKLASAIHALEQRGESSDGDNSRGRKALSLLNCNSEAKVKAELMKDDNSTSIRFKSKESENSSKNPYDQIGVRIDNKTGDVSLFRICKDGQTSMPENLSELKQDADDKTIKDQVSKAQSILDAKYDLSTRAIPPGEKPLTENQLKVLKQVGSALIGQDTASTPRHTLSEISRLFQENSSDAALWKRISKEVGNDFPGDVAAKIAYVNDPQTGKPSLQIPMKEKGKVATIPAQGDPRLDVYDTNYNPYRYSSLMTNAKPEKSLDAVSAIKEFDKEAIQRRKEVEKQNISADKVKTALEFAREAVQTPQKQTGLDASVNKSFEPSPPLSANEKTWRSAIVQALLDTNSASAGMERLQQLFQSEGSKNVNWNRVIPQNLENVKYDPNVDSLLINSGKKFEFDYGVAIPRKGDAQVRSVDMWGSAYKTVAPFDANKTDPLQAYKAIQQKFVIPEVLSEYNQVKSQAGMEWSSRNDGQKPPDLSAGEMLKLCNNYWSSYWKNR